MEKEQELLEAELESLVDDETPIILDADQFRGMNNFIYNNNIILYYFKLSFVCLF